MDGVHPGPFVSRFSDCFGPCPFLLPVPCCARVVEELESPAFVLVNPITRNVALFCSMFCARRCSYALSPSEFSLCGCSWESLKDSFVCPADCEGCASGAWRLVACFLLGTRRVLAEACTALLLSLLSFCFRLPLVFSGCPAGTRRSPLTLTK